MNGSNDDRLSGIVTNVRESYGMAAVTINVGLAEIVEYVTPMMAQRHHLEPGTEVPMRILKSTVVIDDRSA